MYRGIYIKILEIDTKNYNKFQNLRKLMKLIDTTFLFLLFTFKLHLYILLFCVLFKLGI